MEQVGGEEEGVVRASGATEAAGQIDLDDADCSAALEQGPSDEPQSQKSERVTSSSSFITWVMTFNSLLASSEVIAPSLLLLSQALA